MKISRSINVAANGIIVFFSMTEQYCIVYMYHIFFIHSSIGGHLGCFHVLAIVNSAAGSTIYIWWYLFESWFSLGICLGVGLLCMVVLFLVFLRNLHTLLHNSCSNLHSHPQCRRIPFCTHPLYRLLFVDCFLMMSILKCIVILHFSLICISLKISDVKPHMLLGHLYVFFGEMPI